MPSDNDPIKDEPAEEAPDEDVKELMESHDLDKDTAERVQEIMDDLGVDEDDAVEIEESL
jgi:chorismate mutase